MKPLSLIVARSKNGIIGHNGTLPWRYNIEDMRHFRRTTAGHVVIVGRKTWDGIKNSLPGRTKFIVSGHTPPPYELPNTKWFDNLDFAITEAQKLDPEPFIIGGQSIYQQAMPRVTKIYMTTFDETYQGDRWFDVNFEDFARKCFYLTGNLTFEEWERR